MGLKNYLTMQEYADLWQVPVGNVAAAVRDNAIDHCAMMVSKYEKVILIPDSAHMPEKYVPNLDRFPGEEVPPWQGPER